MIFRFLSLFDPFRRRLRKKRYWDLKELAEKQKLIRDEDVPDETSDDADENNKSDNDTDVEN